MLLEVAKNSFSYPLTLLLVVLTRIHARGGGGFRAQSSTKSKHILHQQQDIIVYH